ncbi:MAG: hypothetical protein JWS10_669 [Cypionkella sp.]|uniref:hypothetical protein n=1 Tax=Cypionkella sp. TaxID=2811411 RepID=UPI00260AFE5D|nr:hypothetical protein [Cypionkella sp.]MDB5658054.1 hypothetical protein [Cypionkella sp.]
MAHAFLGIAGIAPESLTLIAKEGEFEAALPCQLFDAPFATVPTSYSAFGRLADAEEDPRTTALLALAHAFVNPVPSTTPSTACLPAIYTYFGQFIAHEVGRLSGSTDGKVINLNTASFDLDTMFFPAGKFPSEILTAAPLCVPFGLAALGNTSPGTTADLSDLPRAVTGEPVVPDRRNDSNPQLAQLHVAILKKYRALLETSSDAQMELTRLLHSITIHDYLRQVIDDCVYNDVLHSGRRLVHAHKDAKNYFLTPIEFAAGAHRFGHTMVRDAYRWRRAAPPPDAALEQLMRQTYAGEGLTFDAGLGPGESIRRIASRWTMEKTDMVRYPGAEEPNLANGIGPALASPLQTLSGKYVQNADPLSEVNLAEKTLMRGQEVMLPCAQSLWALIEPVCGRFLTPEEISGSVGSTFFDALTMKNVDAPTLVERTPLWFYVLREAEVLQGGHKLGPLGGRIVMETIHASIEATGCSPSGLQPATLADLFTETT